MTEIVKTETTEITEPKKEESQEPAAETAKEAATEAKEEAKEHQEAATEAKEEAKEAATEAKEAATTAKNSTSYNEFALKGLMDSVTLVVSRMEQIMNIVKEMKEDFSQVTEELRVTTDLHQEQIGSLDSSVNKLTAATASLIKIHQQMKADQQ